MTVEPEPKLPHDPVAFATAILLAGLTAAVTAAVLLANWPT